MTHSYHIDGMTCKSCIAKVKSELLKIGDIISVDMQLEHPQATIEMNRHISTADLQRAVKKAGDYSIQEDNNSANLLMERTGSSYFPLYLIFGFITIITVIPQVIKGTFSWVAWMNSFMAGFFFVFSFFKFLDIKGFANGYRGYDIIAKRFPVWGFIYPFIELTFAILLLTGMLPFITNLSIFIIMTLSSMGVIISLRNKHHIQCACLGTVINLPLGKVTLFEDLLMIGMSLAMMIAMA